MADDSTTKALRKSLKKLIAEKRFEDVLIASGDVNDEPVALFRAFAQVQLEQFDQSIATFQEILQHNPASNEAKRGLVDSYRRLNKFGPAGHVVMSMLDNSPSEKHPDLVRKACSLLLKSENLSESDVSAIQGCFSNREYAAPALDAVVADCEARPRDEGANRLLMYSDKDTHVASQLLNALKSDTVAGMIPTAGRELANRIVDAGALLPNAVHNSDTAERTKTLWDTISGSEAGHLIDLETILSGFSEAITQDTKLQASLVLLQGPEPTLASAKQFICALTDRQKRFSPGSSVSRAWVTRILPLLCRVVCSVSQRAQWLWTVLDVAADSSKISDTLLVSVVQNSYPTISGAALAQRSTSPGSASARNAVLASARAFLAAAAVELSTPDASLENDRGAYVTFIKLMLPCLALDQLNDDIDSITCGQAVHVLGECPFESAPRDSAAPSHRWLAIYAVIEADVAYHATAKSTCSGHDGCLALVAEALAQAVRRMEAALTEAGGTGTDSLVGLCEAIVAALAWATPGAAAAEGVQLGEEEAWQRMERAGGWGMKGCLLWQHWAALARGKWEVNLDDEDEVCLQAPDTPTWTDDAQRVQRAYLEAAKLSPRSPEPLSLLGALLTVTGSHERAAQCFQKAMVLGSKRAAIACLVADAYLKDGKLADARRTCEAAVSFNPNSFGVLRRLGEVCYRQGEEATLPAEKETRCAASCRHLQKALTVRPEAAHTWSLVGVIYQRQGLLSSALKAASRAVELRPTDPLLLKRLAQVHLMLGQHTEAAEMFRVAVHLRPNDMSARFGEARALVALAFARTNIGLMGIAADALIRASEVMRPCIQDKSCRSAAVWKLVGDIHTTAFKISPSCFGERAYRTLLGEASDSVPESSDTEANPTVWNRGHLALGRRLRGYAEAGAAAYSKLIAMAPEDYRPWADLGFNLLQQYRAARLASGVDSGHLSLQESRAAEADLAEAAARCFRQSARLSPKYDAAWVGIGLTDARPLVAQSALLRAAQLQSGGSNAVTISNAGMLYVELGRLALARRALVAAQSADPTNETMWIGHGLLNEVAAFHASTAGGQTTQEELEELQLRAWRRSAAAYLSAAELTSRFEANAAVGRMELGLNPLRRSAQTAAPGTALAYLRMAAEQNPGDPLVWNGLALAYEQAGRYGHAVEAIEAALERTKAMALPQDHSHVLAVVMNALRIMYSSGQPSTMQTALQQVAVGNAHLFDAVDRAVMECMVLVDTGDLSRLSPMEAEEWNTEHAKLLLARAFATVGNWGACTQCLQFASQTHPNSMRVWRAAVALSGITQDQGLFEFSTSNLVTTANFAPSTEDYDIMALAASALGASATVEKFLKAGVRSCPWAARSWSRVAEHVLSRTTCSMTSLSKAVGLMCQDTARALHSDTIAPRQEGSNSGSAASQVQASSADTSIRLRMLGALVHGGQTGRAHLQREVRLRPWCASVWQIYLLLEARQCMQLLDRSQAKACADRLERHASFSGSDVDKPNEPAGVFDAWYCVQIALIRGIAANDDEDAAQSLASVQGAAWALLPTGAQAVMQALLKALRTAAGGDPKVVVRAVAEVLMAQVAAGTAVLDVGGVGMWLASAWFEAGDLRTASKCATTVLRHGEAADGAGARILPTASQLLLYVIWLTSGEKKRLGKQLAKLHQAQAAMLPPTATTGAAAPVAVDDSASAADQEDQSGGGTPDGGEGTTPMPPPAEDIAGALEALLMDMDGFVAQRLAGKEQGAGRAGVVVYPASAHFDGVRRYQS